MSVPVTYRSQIPVDASMVRSELAGEGHDVAQLRCEETSSPLQRASFPPGCRERRSVGGSNTCIAPTLIDGADMDVNRTVWQLRPTSDPRSKVRKNTSCREQYGYLAGERSGTHRDGFERVVTSQRPAAGMPITERGREEHRLEWPSCYHDTADVRSWGAKTLLWSSEGKRGDLQPLFWLLCESAQASKSGLQTQASRCRGIHCAFSAISNTRSLEARAPATYTAPRTKDQHGTQGK